MTEHTPGPWDVIPPDENSATWFIGRDRLGAPKGVVPEHLQDGRPYYIAVFGVLMERQAAEANARLIAAAPDLLEAAEAALDAMLAHDFGTLTLAPKLRDAIAKARGEGR